MKHRVILAALAVAAAGTLMPAGAYAMKTDDLTGPGSGDTSVAGGALTASATTSADPDSPLPYVSSSRSNQFGNSRFGASYTTNSWTGAPDDNMAEAYEYVGADATAFGDTKNILSSAVYALTNGTTQTANVYSYMYAMGNQIRNVSRDGGEFDGMYNLSNINQKLWDSGSQTFWIGPVPISVSAQVFAGAFQEVGGHVWVDGINGELNQYAGLWVNASAGVGVSWAGGGVRINNLSLVDASLPLAARAQYVDTPTDDSCNSDFAYSANYSLRLQELSGEVRLYAKLVVWSDEYQIASWPGYREDFNLLNFSSQRQYGSCFPITAAPAVASNVIG